MGVGGLQVCLSVASRRILTIQVQIIIPSRHQFHPVELSDSKKAVKRLRGL